MEENVVLDKSYKFALRIVKLYKYLTEEKKEFIMSKQVLLAGTQIGEHVKTAQEAESNSIFYQEFSIALRKATATEFWLQLLYDGGYLEADHFESIGQDCTELKKLTKSIAKSTNPRR
jgi:four helix bundle protein